MLIKLKCKTNKVSPQDTDFDDISSDECSSENDEHASIDLKTSLSGDSLLDEPEYFDIVCIDKKEINDQRLQRNGTIHMHIKELAVMESRKL